MRVERRDGLYTLVCNFMYVCFYVCVRHVRTPCARVLFLLFIQYAVV